MTTQNVAWPMMIVIMPNSMPIVRNVVFERDAGDDARAGRSAGSSEERDRLAPEEPEPLDGERDQRAQDAAAIAVADGRDLER